MALVVVWLFCLAFLILGVLCACVWGKNSQGDFWSGLLVAFIGLACLIPLTFIVIPREMPSGLPVTKIGSGTHKVAFTHIIGENVNVGIEKKVGENERLYLYQFPVSVFDSNTIKTDGKELLVVESRGFRKLVLK